MILETRNLSAGYGRTRMIHDINLGVEPGEIVCLIGANGAGKTTLLRAISGVIPPMGGTVYFDGRDITRHKANKLVTIGLGHVPEGRQIFGDLTVRQNLILGGYARKTTRQESQEVFSYVYDLFPVLRQRMAQKAGTLSGGEQQMLAIGRGLMSRPKMLLLDEPSLGLAPLLVEAILEAIRVLKASGISILLVEQNVGPALTIADRAYVIETGKVVASGAARELLEKDEIRKSYLGM